MSSIDKIKHEYVDTLENVIELLTSMIAELKEEAQNVCDGYWEWHLDEKNKSKIKVPNVTPRIITKKSDDNEREYFSIIWEQSQRHMSGEGFYKKMINKGASKTRYPERTLNRHASEYQIPKVTETEEKFSELRTILQDITKRTRSLKLKVLALNKQ